jgi:hypothetical protein
MLLLFVFLLFGSLIVNCAAFICRSRHVPAITWLRWPRALESVEGLFGRSIDYGIF